MKKFLIVILSLVLVGIIIFGGYDYYRDYEYENAEREMKHELQLLGNMARDYFNKVQSESGEGSFEGWSLPNSYLDTPKGRFLSVSFKNEVRIRCEGKEKLLRQESPLIIIAYVTKDSIHYIIRN